MLRGLLVQFMLVHSRKQLLLVAVQHVEAPLSIVAARTFDGATPPHEHMQPANLVFTCSLSFVICER